MKKKTPNKSFPIVASADEKKTINLDYLKQLTKNNSIAIAGMIEIYLEETPTLINRMKQAINNKDWELLRTTAHSIFPSFSMMGINTDYGKIAKLIQGNATQLLNYIPDEQEENNTITILNELLLKIETVCAQAAEELKKELLELK